MAIAAELGRGQGREAAAELPDGGPGGAEDHGVGHCRDSSIRAFAWTFAPPPSAPSDGGGHDRRRPLRGRGDRARHAGRRLGALVDSGEASRGFRKLALTHADGKRWLIAGLGKRDEFDPERARIVAGGVVGRARELGTRSLCWELPHHVADADAGRVRRGHAARRLRVHAFKSRGDEDDDGRQLAELIVSAHHDVAGPVETGRVVGEAANAARDLQNAPANDLTPTALAERAREIADEIDALTLEIIGRDEIEAAGMGAFAGVAQGSDEEPQLITLRYERPDAAGPVLGFVGKAVTFDSGGISIKPGIEDERDEVRHVGRRRRARGHRRDRAARPAGPADRGDRRDREPARPGTR